MDSELPAVNTAQLETLVFHRDRNEPPSSQQSVTNRCSTSRSFDQNFAQLPSVEVPLVEPPSVEPPSDSALCPMLNLVQLLQMLIIMTILTTHWRLRSKCLLEVKGIQTSLAQCQWCTHTLIPRFFIEIKLPASPLIIMMITLPMEQNSAVFFLNLQNQLLQTSIHQLCHGKFQVQSLPLSLHLRIWQNELFQRTMTRKPR